MFSLYIRWLRLCAAVWFVAAVGIGVVSADIPNLISYQGRLVDDTGQPLDGPQTVTFKIYSSPLAGLPLWSSGPQIIEVEEGLFTYNLGSNAPLPEDIFAGNGIRYLGITIGADPESTPLIQLTSVPYAHRALYAENVPAGGGWSQGAGTVYLTNPSDNVGIGVSSPSEPLVIGANLGDYSGNMLAVGNPDPGSFAGMTVGQDADSRFYMVWDNTHKYLYAGIRANGTWYSNNLVLRSGRVGIGLNDPTERLVVGKDLGYHTGELIVVGNDLAGEYSGVKFGEDSDNCGTVLWSNDNNAMCFVTKESGTEQDTMIFRGGKLAVGELSPYAAITGKKSGTAIIGEDIPGSFGGLGVLGKSSDEAGTGLKGIGAGVDGKGVVGQASASGGHGVHAEAISGARVALYAEADVTAGIGIEAHGGSGGLAGKFYGNVALYSPNDEHLIMILGEGLDYAEGFHASEPRRAKPGTVMSIDPDHPGKLMLSTTAYDSKVAGIVAGANNLGSGVRLGTEDFDLDVALAGRVYCNVEATRHAVQPGDLLTTSSVPGYAMKATDYARAQGAVLGKAMESLEYGEKGQILVLVTLQ